MNRRKNKDTSSFYLAIPYQRIWVFDSNICPSVYYVMSASWCKVRDDIGGDHYPSLMWGVSRASGADTAAGGGVAHVRMRRGSGPPLLLVPRRHVGEHAEHGVADLVSLQHTDQLSQCNNCPACHMQEVINLCVEIEINNHHFSLKRFILPLSKSAQLSWGFIVRVSGSRTAKP